MLDPTELYEIEDTDEAAIIADGGDDDPERPLVLVHQLGGAIDAGDAGRLAAEHLLDALPATVLAIFDVDQLLDYRSRRPSMTYENNRWSDYDEPLLALYALRDLAGTPFLLLAGPEPDVQWERFIAAVIQLVERFGVDLTVGVHAIPMAVPHTRPSGVTAHGTRPELLVDHELWEGSAELPGSASGLLEYRLGQAGHDAMGLAAHVPHYLAETEFPQAARALLDHLSITTGLLLPTDALSEAAAQVGDAIERKVASSEQASKVVRALEQQYDRGAEGRRHRQLLADDQQLPTADELGAEVERFLAERDPDSSD